MDQGGHREEGRPSPFVSIRTRRDRLLAEAEEQISQDRRQHMEKVARYVVFEDIGGPDPETILRKLLFITGNDGRWGFLLPDHPHHTYYKLRKAALRRQRLPRPPCTK